MQTRKFYCGNCDHSFWGSVAENIAEELLFKECPECRLAVGLYQLAGPLTNKRLQDWGLGEVNGLLYTLSIIDGLNPRRDAQFG